MTDFEGHKRLGYYAIGIYSLVAISSLGVYPSLLSHIPGIIGLGSIIVLAGAFFPDIDHHASIPHKKFKQGMSLIGGILLATGVIALSPYLQSRISISQLPNECIIAVATVASFIIGNKAVSVLVTRFRPKHRGITHKKTTGLIIASIIYVSVSTQAINLPVSDTYAPFLAIAWISGFLSHLYGDNMLSS